MYRRNFLRSLVILIAVSVQANTAYADQMQTELYKNSKFVLGVGAAIVRFDTNIKITDKQSGKKIYLDLEGNLDMPEISSVLTLYGAYQINQKHRIGFSFFGINRESEVFNIDKSFEDYRVAGSASITDTTNFYRLDYGYNLFRDFNSKIDLKAGIYALDLKYVYQADGDITIDGVTTSDTVVDDTSVFAPLPLIGLDFSFRITEDWSLANKLAFIAGSYDDLSAIVVHVSIDALYRFNQNVGVVMGLTYFDADIDIESSSKTRDISYGYDGAYIGMHFYL